jgi:ABC-2 type transport system ATP-binding protein
VSAKRRLNWRWLAAGRCGRSSARWKTKSRKALAEVVAAEGLRKTYGEREALLGLDFCLEGPQVVGILGPNGAGKTTLLDLLEGLSEPSQGSVRLFGESLKPGHYPRQRVGVVLQREFALGGILVGEYAELLAAIYGVRGGREQILDRARLSERQRVPLERISGGEAQRLFIAAAAVHRPELLFLDEPTAHLDPTHKREVGQMLRELSTDCTVVLTTHDLHEAEAVCDHLLFLVDGRLRAQGTRQALLAQVPAGAAPATMEDAFFHYCESRIDKRGELQ